MDVGVLLFGGIGRAVLGAIYVVLHRLLGCKPWDLSGKPNQFTVGAWFHGTGYGFGHGRGRAGDIGGDIGGGDGGGDGGG